MEYIGIIAFGVSIIGFTWVWIDRERKEGSHLQIVEQLRKDVDHAHKRCRDLESGAASSNTAIAILSTKIDGIVESIGEIKSMLENMRTTPRGGK